MNVLSLFDGMSCGQIALNRIGLTPSKYYAAEFDKYTIKVTQANYPKTIQMGDVTKWREWDINWAGIDLLIGGSPCQGFSFAGKQLAFDDPRSKLFFVYLDILNHIKSVNPRVKFMLENVKMKKEYLAVITEKLGVEPVFINSALVSAQNRQRYYWANWEVEQLKDRGILLGDILERNVDESYFHTEKALKYMNRSVKGGRTHWDFKHHSNDDDEKSQCVTANIYKGVPYNVLITSKKGYGYNRKDGLRNELTKAYPLNASDWRGLNRNQTQTAIVDKKGCRKLTPIECERLQTVPDNYTNHVSNTQRYKMLGNGWTVDVLCELFKDMMIDNLGIRKCH